MFWRKKAYDRSAVLDAADKARGRGRVRKAIAGYSQILAQDPNDHQVHARIAPLLASEERRDARRAWRPDFSKVLRRPRPEK